MGYSLDRIVLMPYGAVVSGDIAGISSKQEIAICVAGPLVNGATALFFVALWWLFPETYPYTDVAAHVSFSLFLVNLLPAYPLDGGRILRALLRPLGERRAKNICLAVTLFTAVFLVGAFVYSCRQAPNFSILAFAVFLVAGCFGGGKYARVRFEKSKAFARGIEEKRIALSAQATAGYALRFLRDDCYTVFVLFEEGEFFGELSEEEFLQAVEKEDWSQPLAKLIRQI